MGNVKPYAILLKVLFGELLVIFQSFSLLKIFTANVFYHTVYAVRHSLSIILLIMLI